MMRHQPELAQTPPYLHKYVEGAKPIRWDKENMVLEKKDPVDPRLVESPSSSFLVPFSTDRPSKLRMKGGGMM